MYTQSVIFDMDGTLANITHRLGYVRTKPKNWPAFEAAIPKDQPVPEIVELLKLYNRDYNIIIASGRSEKSRQDTIDWLNKYQIPFGNLYMRKDGDYRRDDIVKQEILDQIYKDGHTVRIVVDDRNSVCQMWRDNGLICLQCAPGDF